jgi:hypothetical protein
LPLLESFPVSELPRCAVPGFPIRLAEDQYHGTVAGGRKGWHEFFD